LLRELHLRLEKAIDELPDAPKARTIPLADLQVMQSCLAEALALIEPDVQPCSTEPDRRRSHRSAKATSRLRELLGVVRDGFDRALQEPAPHPFDDRLPFLLPDGSENRDVDQAARYLRKFLVSSKPPNNLSS
jgi:hypothetical protein